MLSRRRALRRPTSRLRLRDLAGFDQGETNSIPASVRRLIGGASEVPMSRTAMTKFPQLPTRRHAPSTGGGRGRSIHPSPTVRNPRIPNRTCRPESSGASTTPKPGQAWRRLSLLNRRRPHAVSNLVARPFSATDVAIRSSVTQLDPSASDLLQSPHRHPGDRTCPKIGEWPSVLLSPTQGGRGPSSAATVPSEKTTPAMGVVVGCDEGGRLGGRFR
jgi:hypothetical protein